MSDAVTTALTAYWNNRFPTMQALRVTLQLSKFHPQSGNFNAFWSLACLRGELKQPLASGCRIYLIPIEGVLAEEEEALAYLGIHT